MANTSAKLIEGGRVVIPSSIRKTLGLHQGDTLLMEVHDGALHIRAAKSALKNLQDKLQRLNVHDGLVSDKLIADRRAEAARE